MCFNSNINSSLPSTTGSPSVISPSEQFAAYNDEAVLECEVRSVPAPSLLQWSRRDGGQPLDVTALGRYVVDKTITTISMIKS